MEKGKALFNPVLSKRSFEEVSGEIKKLLFAGGLRPGDRLPSELDLARQFDVSRQTIREALRGLEQSGFLRVQQGGAGRVIVDTLPNSISNAFLDAIQYHSVSMHDLTAARLEIEKVILRSSVRKADAFDIILLQDNVKRARARTRGGLSASEENVQFHHLLAQAAKNKVFEIVLQTLMLVVSYFLAKLEPDTESSSRVIDAHERILEALVQRDEGLVLERMESHLLEVRDRLQTVIDMKTGARVA